nr:zinc finger, CCHC-type [Tanacetum cinerariifolium]
MKYQMVCTRLDIASADVGMLDKFDHGLQIDVQEIWLKVLLTESRYKLRLVAGIATGVLVKGDSRAEVPSQVAAGGYQQVKVLEFFDCPGRQGVEDLRDESMEYMMKNVFGLRWNCRELKGIMKLRFSKKRNIRLSGRSKGVMFLILVIKVLHTMYEEWGRQTFGSCRDTAAEWVVNETNVILFAKKDGLKDDMDAQSDVYVLSNGCRKCSDDSDGYYKEYTPEGSLSEDCDVEKNGKWSCIYADGSQEYQMVCTRLDIASVDVGVLDKFDHGLQIDVHIFVDFDYAMGRSITVMESRYELRLVAGIATGILVKGSSRAEVPAQVELLRIGLSVLTNSDTNVKIVRNSIHFSQ